jgi:hypothetical protein
VFLICAVEVEIEFLALKLILIMILIYLVSLLNVIDAFNLNNHCQLRVPMRTFTNVTRQSFAPFILNGTPADIENYKFKLSLHIRDTFYCSASVISASFSLTAGNEIYFCHLTIFNV